MNDRDPFSLRRSTPAFHLLHGGIASIGDKAVQVSQQAVEIVLETREVVGRVVTGGLEDSVAMAYTQQSGATHRHGDPWQASGQSRYSANGYANGTTNGSVSEKIGDMFSGDRKNSLPMYKDKPFQYPGGRRKMPWFRRKRVMALVLASLAGLSWWFGVLSPLSYFMGGSDAAPARKSKSWFGSGGVVDWDERAEKVKEAFRVSFADYEKHAWGMCRVWPPLCTGSGNAG